MLGQSAPKPEYEQETAMKKLRVVTVVGTRPEIIRLSRVLARLDEYCDHVLVHTGQNYDYELNEIFFRDLEVRKPDHFLEAAGAGAAETDRKSVVEGESGAQEGRGVNKKKRQEK